VTSVLVTGSSGAAETARLIAAALRDQGIGAGLLAASGMSLEGCPVEDPLDDGPRTALLRRCVAADIAVAIQEVAHADIPSSVAAGPITVAVLSGFSDADMPPGGDVERHLAEIAQLFLRARGLRAAVLPMDDPGAELLAEVIPPGVRILRFEARESSGPLARAAAAARLVVLALGRSPQSAGGELC
jgi:hypothetical protein